MALNWLLQGAIYASLLFLLVLFYSMKAKYMALIWIIAIIAIYFAYRTGGVVFYIIGVSVFVLLFVLGTQGLGWLDNMKEGFDDAKGASAGLQGLVLNKATGQFCSIGPDGNCPLETVAEVEKLHQENGELSGKLKDGSTYNLKTSGMTKTGICRLSDGSFGISNPELYGPGCHKINKQLTAPAPNAPKAHTAAKSGVPAQPKEPILKPAEFSPCLQGEEHYNYCQSVFGKNYYPGETRKSSCIAGHSQTKCVENPNGNQINDSTDTTCLPMDATDFNAVCMSKLASNSAGYKDLMAGEDGYCIDPESGQYSKKWARARCGLFYKNGKPTKLVSDPIPQATSSERDLDQACQDKFDSFHMIARDVTYEDTPMGMVRAVCEVMNPDSLKPPKPDPTVLF